MSKPCTIIVIFEAKAGKEDELASALRAVVEPSRSEDICLEYKLHQSDDNPAQFVMYEQWVSKDKLQEHFDKPYIIELRKKFETLLAKPSQMIFATELI
ncbi:putative quinol monooxygenase [Legionella sp. D16C41]|uniref:putative quinol monooxygenase n=1 Tax=Legionella sp. D16C41 TaxID=3402688 RepID=UPI003AF84FB9